MGKSFTLVSTLLAFGIGIRILIMLVLDMKGMKR
jgi:hypothetical protein